MFLLITGASGAGKSTVRLDVAPQFTDVLEAAELAELGGEPQWTLEWRHQAVERAVCRALAAQAAGRHFLLCGDPVPPGEVIAAPSADRLNGLAVCLLDVRPEVQTVDSARAVTIHLSSRAITRSPSGCVITSKTRHIGRM